MELISRLSVHTAIISLDLARFLLSELTIEHINVFCDVAVATSTVVVDHVHVHIHLIV